MMKVNRKGVTLIELLIVVVIVAILTAIAIPRFSTTKEKGYMAQMKSDLRNLTTSEETYAADNMGAYIPAGTATTAAPWNGATATTGVTLTIDAPGPSSYTATATHNMVPGKICGIYYGLAAAPGGTNPATAPSEPKCN